MNAVAARKRDVDSRGQVAVRNRQQDYSSMRLKAVIPVVDARGPQCYSPKLAVLLKEARSVNQRSRSAERRSPAGETDRGF